MAATNVSINVTCDTTAFRAGLERARVLLSAFPRPARSARKRLARLIHRPKSDLFVIRSGDFDRKRCVQHMTIMPSPKLLAAIESLGGQ